MHPEAGTVRVDPGEAETIARNTLASHSTSDDLMIVEELPGRKYLLSGLISQLSVSLSSWKAAWRRRLRHWATAWKGGGFLNLLLFFYKFIFCWCSICQHIEYHPVLIPSSDHSVPITQSPTPAAHLPFHHP